MHKRTLLLLFVVVAALVGAVLWQMRREARDTATLDGALVEAFERGRVNAIRVDNLERSLQMRIERDAQGRWMIVDPIEFPVELALLDALFSTLETQRLKPPLVDDRSKLSLAPPRVVIELVEDVAGKPRTTRIEIGAVDIGDQFVYVARDGQLGRTERALDTLLERDLPDWRSHYVMQFDARLTTEITREGQLFVPGDPEPLDLDLRAAVDGEWKSTAPFVAQLDPRAIGTLINSLAGMRAEAFVDTPGPLEFYGLATPRVRIEVVDARGVKQSVRMSPEPSGEMWYVMREDLPYVYRASPMSVGMCMAPSEGLIERNLARVARNDVTGLEVSFEGHSFRLERADRVWRVSGRNGDVVTLQDAPADDALVGDALAVVEQAHVDQLFFDRTLSPSELTGSVRLELSGESIGGVLGPAQHSADGVEGVLFRRDGDGVVGMLSERVLRLARRDAASFQSLALHKAPEIDIARIEVALGEKRRVYVRDEHGHWSREGSTSEAKEFGRLVDSLLSMRAKRMLKRGEDQLTDSLSIEIVPYSGKRLAFDLGQATIDGASSPVYRTGSLFAVVGAEPHATLLGLMRAD